MYVNRSYHSQWISKHRFYGLRKTRRRHFHTGNPADDHYSNVVPRKPCCLLQGHEPNVLERGYINTKPTWTGVRRRCAVVRSRLFLSWRGR